MINLMENKVLGPLLQQQFEQGERKGRGEGQQDLLQELLTEKFGSLPVWALQRLRGAGVEDLILGPSAFSAAQRSKIHCAKAIGASMSP